MLSKLERKCKRAIKCGKKFCRKAGKMKKLFKKITNLVTKAWYK